MSALEIAEGLRRVITGNNASGKSVIAIDDGPAEVLENGTIGLYEVWSDKGEAILRTNHEDVAQGDVILAPPANGVRVRWFSIAPFGKDVSADEQLDSLNKAFDAMGGHGSRVNVDSHPGMHLTKTMDVVAVFKGRIKLIMEDGEVELKPGDVVIQRGTNHAWEAVGDETAICLGVLVDRELA
jgi:mannose-6-phosphate isomerase-like protein (cupin superfamily)